MKKEFRIAIIGGGPAGVMCALHAAKNPNNKIYLIEQKELLHTLLRTGGGRCNLAHFESDSKKLAENYPRGQKFLYSPFSKFSVFETITFFEKLGLKIKIQDDNRIFPLSDSAEEVQKILVDELDRYANIRVIKFRAYNIGIKGHGFVIDLFKNDLLVDAVVISTGANNSGYRLAAVAGHQVVQPIPSLCPLIIREIQFYSLPGVSIQNVAATVMFDGDVLYKLEGDLLFTHDSISGPIILEISSRCALVHFSIEHPLVIEMNFVNKDYDKFKGTFMDEIRKNPKKDIINVCSKFVTRYLAALLLEESEIPTDLNCAEVPNFKINTLLEKLTSYHVHAVRRDSKSAIVTAGGISLKEIDNKTMQSKKRKHLYFCGEVIDVDGLCGGFNLQNCWTTGYIAGMALAKN